MNTTKKTSDQAMGFDIVNGPNKHVLFDACKYAYDKSAHVKARFVVALAYTNSEIGRGAYVPMEIRNTKVYSIQHEDGSGESFNIEGWCEAKIPTVGCGEVVFKDYRVHGCYNTKTRKGFLYFEE